MFLALDNDPPYPLNSDAVQAATTDGGLQGGQGAFGDQDICLEGAGQRLYPCSKIDLVPDHRVVHLLAFGADIPHHRFTGIDPDPY